MEVASVDEEDTKVSHGNRKSKTITTAKEEHSLLLQNSRREHSPSEIAEPASPHRPPIPKSMSLITKSGTERQHAQLHSYGADFHSSFGPLPYPSAETRAPGAPGHGRKPSYSEEMPPPSERLLRTIIDSVPVQIFTAEPDTGDVRILHRRPF